MSGGHQTACALFPSKMPVGDTSIAAVFGGGDVSVLLPVPAASAADTRARHLEQLYKRSQDYIHVLRAAIDASCQAVHEPAAAAAPPPPPPPATAAYEDLLRSYQRLLGDLEETKQELAAARGGGGGGGQAEATPHHR
jgi:hypothetical protein